MADNDILQGFQLGFQSSLQRQRMKSEAALQRLQEQQIAQVMALRMQENALQNQFRAEMATAMQTFQDVTADEIMMPMPGAEVGTSVPGSDMAPPLMPVKNPNPMRRIDAAMQTIVPVIGKYQPDKVGSVVNDLLLNEVRMQQQRDENYEPTAGVVTTPSGKKIEYFKTSPRSAQAVIEPTIENVVNPETGQSTPVLRTGTSTARPLPADIAGRMTKQKMLDFALKNPDLAVDDPENPGGKIIPPENWAVAAQRMSMQPGTRGQLEQQSISAENVFAIGRRFLPLLNDQTVGIPGFWRREIVARVPFVDKVFGTEGVADAVAAESAARQFMANVVKTLRSDSNISEPERKTLERVAPDPTQLLTKPNTEKVKLYEFLVNAATLSRNNAAKKGVPITPSFLTLDEIAARVPETERPPDRSKNEITEEEAKIMWEESAMNMIQQLRREVGR